MRYFPVLTVGLLSLTPILRAGDAKVAVIYPVDDPKVSTIGNEATCITTGVFEEAKKAGLKFSYKFFDNQRDVIKTATAVDRVVAEAFDIAIGTTTSSEAIVAAKILDKAHIPFFATTASHPDVTKDHPYALRLSFDDYYQAEQLARFASGDLKASRVVVVRNTSIPYSTFLTSEFTSHFRTMAPKAELKELSIIDGFSKYGELVEQILAAKPELVFLPLYAPDVANIYNEIARKDLPMTLLGSDTVGGRKSFFSILKGTTPKITLVFVKSWNGEAEGPEKDNFLKMSKQYCKDQDVTGISALAYDVARAVVLALKQAPSARGLDVISNIRSLKYPGVTGILRFNTRGEPDKPLYLYKIESMKAVFWKKYP